MVDLTGIGHAVNIIEQNRSLLGEEITETALAALREQLEQFRKTAVPQPHAAQRKQVTILFANISGLSSLADVVPDLNALNLLDLLWGRLDQAILAQGGYVDKHMGDIVMGVFSVPAAREDDPERAIWAALAMQTALRGFVIEMLQQAQFASIAVDPRVSTGILTATRLLDRLQIRIGINTGLVLLSEVGSGAEYTVIGDAVNVASRLQQRAPANGILISKSTYNLVSRLVDVDSVGAMALKGRPRQESGFLVRGLQKRPYPKPHRTMNGIPTRMLDREQDIELLQNTFRRVVADRQSHFLMVTGDSGMGKSLLAAEFDEFVQSEWPDALIVHSRFEQRFRNLPYTLPQNLFDTTFVSAQPSELRHDLIQLLGESETAVAHWLPILSGILGGGAHLSADNYSVEENTRPLDLEQAAEFWTAVARHSSGMLLILDDLQWADVGSLQWLLELICRTHEAALFVVGLARPLFSEQQPEWIDAASNQLAYRFVTHSLRPLSLRASRQLITNILHKLSDIPDALFQTIHETAAGNPFFVAELINVLLEDGVIVTEGTAWHFDRHAFSRPRIPITLIGVIQARLDHLPYQERITLQRAAVVGREFWDGALHIINQAVPQPVSDSQISTALDALVQRDMISPLPEASFNQQRGYLFKHAVVREVAYESVLLRERPLYHRLTAEWLVANCGERLIDYAGIIGEHFELAEVTQPAAEYYELAARRAADFVDFESAIACYQKALALGGNLPHQLDWQLTVYQQLIPLLQMEIRLVEALQAARQMADAAQAIGDLGIQTWALLQMAQLAFEQADFAEAIKLAQQAEQIGRLAGAEFEVIHVQKILAQSQAALGHIDFALDSANRALSVGQKLNDDLEICACFELLGQIYLENGRSEDGRRYLAHQAELLLNLGEQGSAPKLLAGCQLHFGRLSNAFGETGQAVHALESALSVHRQMENLADVGAALDGLGTAALLEGQHDKSIQYFEEAIVAAISSGNHFKACTHRLHLAEALHVAGRNMLAAETLTVLAQLVQDSTRISGWRRMDQLRRLLNKSNLPDAT